MPLDVNRIQAICFDVDGTLRDTDDQYVYLLAKSMGFIRFFHPDFDPDRLARWLVMKTETPVNFLYGIPDLLGVDDEIAAVTERLHASAMIKSSRHFLVIPGIQEALAQLASFFPLAVVSARGRRGTMEFLQHTHVAHYFKAVATAQTVHRTKPHPAPVVWAAQQMAVSPHRCLMVGDTTVDILAGQRAGAQTVGVLSGFGERSELVRKGADLILDSAAALPVLLGVNDFRNHDHKG